MIPAAVTVATVAEPVASRISTATTQASDQRARSTCLDALADRVADAGVDQHALEAAAGADDEQDRGGRRERRAEQVGHLLRGRSRARSRSVYMATSTPISSAMIGSPMKSPTLRTWSSSSKDDVDERAREHDRDGQQDGEQRRRRSWAGCRSCASLRDLLAQVLRRVGVRPARREAGEHRAGDDHRRDGDDEAVEHRQAEVGVERVDGDQRARVRRQQAVQDAQAGQRRDADEQVGVAAARVRRARR